MEVVVNHALLVPLWEGWKGVLSCGGDQVWLLTDLKMLFHNSGGFLEPNDYRVV